MSEQREPLSSGADGERLVFVTGLSGAGKSAAMKCFEDMGFFCSDNVPTVLLPDFVRVLAERREAAPRVAVVVDVRGRDFFDEFVPIYRRLQESHRPRPEIVFLDASDEVLLRRFSETKRPHPLALDRPAREGIEEERRRLRPVRDIADLVIDTSNFNPYQLREHLRTIYQSGHPLVVAVRSFGFKFGVPLDADLVFDVRFLPNPHYDPALRPRTGEDAEVDAFVFAGEEARAFYRALEQFVRPLLPRYVREGKAYLNIAVGCTGGRHRSVAVARRLAEALRGDGWAVVLEHRDVEKE